ncbi:MAG TPA: hemolysin family protein [Vicinamibacterales bacterium]|nr:hemolysin family protein [Vicinamibacterales bacterium]
MIGVFVVLACLGLLFFALVETAFGLLMRLPQRLEAERESESEALQSYLADPLTFFIPSRVMRGSLLVVAVALLAQPTDRTVSGLLVLLASGIGISIGLGQLLPAIMVRRSPERTLEYLLPAFTLAANLIAPLTALIIGWIGSAEPRARHESTNGTPAAAFVPSSEPASREQRDEGRLLRSVVDFGDTLVREVMTPRPDIVAIASESTIDDLRRLVQEHEYSRLPVFTENLDNIAGVIVVKDLIQMKEMPAGTAQISTIMRPASFVPETKRVADLLREFQNGRFQLAIVVDEYGGTAGLVTVEDVVEELVGEIRDEYDSEAELVVREADHAFIFSGKVAISEMAERLGVEIDEGEFETVGGWVLTRVGRVPVVGEHFGSDGLDVEIVEADRRRIHKVRIRRQSPPADDGEA